MTFDPQSQLTLVARSQPNWAAHSGADRIASFLPGEHLWLKQASPAIVRAAMMPIRRAIWFPRNRRYDPDHARLERRVARKWRGSEGRVFHFLAGENEFMLSAKLKRRPKNYLVATFHAPLYELVQSLPQPGHLAALDAAIVVGSQMKEYFEPLLSPDRVFVVPLAIDDAYWTPTEDAPQTPPRRLLIVGDHLRDFAALRRIARGLAQRAPDVIIDAIVSTSAGRYLQGLPNLQLHGRVSDEDLRSLYRGATALLCPLISITASLSIGESLSCATPVIATDIDSVRDYLDEDCAILTHPGRSDDMVDAACTLLADKARWSDMRHHARQRAERFGMARVAEQLTEVYTELTRRPIISSVGS